MRGVTPSCDPLRGLPNRPPSNAAANAAALCICAILSDVQRPFALLVLLALSSSAAAQDALQWSGFALLRAGSDVETGPLRSEPVSSQVQVGVDWTPSPRFGAHVHLLGRTDDGSRRGHAGVVEAYAEANFRPHGDRLRLRGGAFFLPGSRENVDALWESPYTITASALNSWLGEELRPIGVDATYFRRGAMLGATVFRGNDTLGALPAVRGWSLDDHWTLLGEWIPVDTEDFTSVSAETDGRIGWSARAGWSGRDISVQLTHFDNRSDGHDYGRLFNWGTRFTIASAELTRGDWTVIGESGWGPTFLVVDGTTYVTDLEASYVLVSRRWTRGRASVRIDRFRVDDVRENAVTIAWLWTPPGRLRPGIELSSSGGERRAIIELRYNFSRN